MHPEELCVLRAVEVRATPVEEPRWLVDCLWGAGAVGIIGGAPKSCKTWLALELAVAVASGRPCLGRFAVPRSGPALLFAAEDAPQEVRARLQSIARARSIEFASLDVRLIVEPSLRLDSEKDLARLRSTLDTHRPRLLVLDPYVRLQRADENDARQVSAILSALRDLSRRFECALALVHHARKNAAERPGQALRGSGDFWAWGDSNLYIARKGEGLLLSIEHRSAASPPPLILTLESSQDAQKAEEATVCLKVLDTIPLPAAAAPPPLCQRILTHIEEAGPSSHRSLRSALRVRDVSLSEALRTLEQEGRLARSHYGWSLQSVP